MDDTQLSQPLLSEVKTMERDALLSMMVDKKFKTNEVEPFSAQVSNEKAEQDPMKEALINISTDFKGLLPSEVNMPYIFTSVIELSDKTHYLASTAEGLAVYIDMKTKTFEEKKISEMLGFAAVLKGERKAIFSGATTLHEVKLPSLIPVKDKTFDFGIQISKMIQSSDQNSLYVLLKEQKIVKVNPENFEERKDILEGNFTQMAISRTGELVTFSNDGKLTLTNLKTLSQEEVHINIDGEIIYLDLSPSQSKIIAASSKTVVIVNVSPLEVFTVFKMKIDFFSVAIANDENTLIVGDELGKLLFWDIKTKKQISEVQVHSKTIVLMKLSSDGKWIYTNGLDGKFYLLRFPELAKELSTRANNFKIFPSGSNLFLKDKDENVFKKWDLVNNKIEEIATYNEDDIDSYDFVDESTIIFPTKDSSSIIKHNFISKETDQIPLVGNNTDFINAHALSLNKRYYATGGEAQKVCVWNLKTMNKTIEFWGSNRSISKIIFLQPSYVAAGNDVGSVYIWSISDDKFKFSPLKVFKDQKIKSLNAFQNDENLVIGNEGENGSILIYNWRGRALLATLNAGGELNKIHIVRDEKSMIVAINEGKITFWSLITYNQLFHYDIKQEIVQFGLTADEKYLAYIINIKKEEKNEKEIEDEEDKEDKEDKEEEEEEELEQNEGEIEKEEENEERKKNDKEEADEKLISGTDNLFIKKNPLETNMLIAAQTGSDFSYMKYIINLINNKRKQHKPEFDKWIIMPYRINTLHLYSYFNHSNLLKLALDAGGLLFDTNFDENAWSIAIKKQFSGCVSAIMYSFGKLLKENPNALNFISQDSIIGLNKLGYPLLTKFYKLIYTPYKGKFVKFVDESSPTPIFYNSREIIPVESNFSLQGENKTEGKPVICMSTSVPLPLINGSKASTDFLSSLEECPNSAIFTTKLIQDILDHKWETLKWAMYWQAIMYTIYMILLSVYLLYSIGQFIVFSLLLSSYEVFQLYASPSDYINDIWNYIDAVRTILTIVYVSLNWAEDKHSDLSYDILVGLVVISWLRGITYFRVFKNTRYMVNLISEVIKDITSFLILLFYSTLAFAFIFLVMDKNDPQLIDYIKLSYRLDLGDFDSTGFTSTQWICLFLATMINMIIMLNLLISIMGDTFGRVQVNAEIADRKELLGMISEIEKLMYWERDSSERSYFQALTDEEYEEKENNVKTRVAIIKKNIKIFHLQNLKCHWEHQKRFEALEEMMKKIWTKLEGDKKVEGEHKKDSDKKSRKEKGEESKEESGDEIQVD